MNKTAKKPTKLKAITVPLKKYINELPKDLAKGKVAANSNQLPLPYQLAALRGEAVLRLRFFDFLSEHHVADLQRQLDLYNLLIQDRSRISDLVRRIGLALLTTGSNGGELATETAFQLYCGFINDLHSHNEHSLLRLATDTFFYHHLVGLYPKQVKAKSKGAKQLRQQAMNKLHKKIGYNIELKESFTTNENGVDFGLRLKDGSEPWQEVLRITGSKLNQTRQAAYRQLIDTLKQDSALVAINDQN